MQQRDSYPQYKIKLFYALFFVLTPLLGIAGSIYILVTRGFCWQTWAFAATIMMITGLSITGGYHRLFSHRSYQTNWLIKSIFLLFGAGAFEGSALMWCSNHRRHHIHTDTALDPHNIKRGFFHAHIGWIFLDSNYKIENVNDLIKDRLLRWQDKYYVPLGITMSFIIPTLIAGLCWGDYLGGFIIASVLRIAFVHHGTFMINSGAHYFGRQPHSQKDTARDNWWISLFTFGEGFHNYHHAYPYDYRNGVRFYHWDPTKWLITFLKFTGLASNLRKAPPINNSGADTEKVIQDAG